ncbi:hypothetical protein [Pedobacter ginsengisoli]|uniref:hypothetical protein n=1 Tax=Pedobacter ginsengisoli TaxID=363852 RepID=UPI002550237B|nr:hypothetical protein [Pedobacter ginsengisoli]
MKILLVTCFLLVGEICYGQTYEALSYHKNSSPVNGVNIHTNLPYNGTQMVNLHFQGYSYGSSETISFDIVYYIFNDSFVSSSISSAGSYTPEVWLTNNAGLVNIFIDDRVYYQRFKITAFVKGLSEQATWFSGWTAMDEPMQGTNTKQLVYKNKFKGTVTNLGNTFLTGDVGIGTTNTQGHKLAVNGKIRAQEIKVELANWPDFVFSRSYKLPTLQETESHIKEKGHLPGIPSAAEVEKNGIELGDMNKKLLQKIEELTLYLIEKDKQLNEERKLNKEQDERLKKVELLIKK